MKFIIVAIAALAAFSIVSAFPTFVHYNRFPKRHIFMNNTVGDRALYFASFYEKLTSAFYNEGLNQFNREAFNNAGYNDSVYDEFLRMRSHDTEQADAIQSVISAWSNNTHATHGNTTVPPPINCEFSFNLTDVNSFVLIARVLENVGVSAYLGQLGNINNTHRLGPSDTRGIHHPTNNNTQNGNSTMIHTGNYTILQMVADITAVDARNAAFLNWVYNGTAAPYAFDTPLTIPEALTIVRPYVTTPNCTNSLSENIYLPLNVILPANGTGSISMDYDTTATSRNATYCQLLYGNMLNISPFDSCSLPEGVDGYVYVFATDSPDTVRPAHNASNIVAGPNIAFNDVNNSTGSQ